MRQWGTTVKRMDAVYMLHLLIAVTSIIHVLTCLTALVAREMEHELPPEKVCTRVSSACVGT